MDKIGQQWVQASDGGWWFLPGWPKRGTAKRAMDGLLAASPREAVGVKVTMTKEGRFTVHAARILHKGFWYGKGANPSNPFVETVLDALAPVAVEVQEVLAWPKQN